MRPYIISIYERYAGSYLSRILYKEVGWYQNRENAERKHNRIIPNIRQRPYNFKSTFWEAFIGEMLIYFLVLSLAAKRSSRFHFVSLWVCLRVCLFVSYTFLTYLNRHCTHLTLFHPDLENSAGKWHLDFFNCEGSSTFNLVS